MHLELSPLNPEGIICAEQGKILNNQAYTVNLKLSILPGGGVLPYKRLMGMCRWMGSHFHDWIDYNGVTFLVELLEWGRTFSGFLG